MVPLLPSRAWPGRCKPLLALRRSRASTWISPSCVPPATPSIPPIWTLPVRSRASFRSRWPTSSGRRALSGKDLLPGLSHAPGPRRRAPVDYRRSAAQSLPPARLCRRQRLHAGDPEDFGEEMAVTASSAQLRTSSSRSWSNSRTVRLPSTSRRRIDGSSLVADVAVVTSVGHKFPTGFPSRRAWIHLVVQDACGPGGL